MREQFIEWRPQRKTLQLVDTITSICEELDAQGYELTVRQLYYQLVARDIIPNNFKSYKQIVSVTDSARLAGMLDWRYIVDRTRAAYRSDGIDESPEEAIRLTARAYSRALWESQPNHVEVWVEKEALSGIVSQAASGVRVIHFANRGYVSQSEMYSAGLRFRSTGRRGKSNYVIHLGDHDPSGIDMTRDIEDRLLMFAGRHAPTVRRIALNMAQIEEFNPPPNFAKVTDARYANYEAEYGDQSWELDALNPSTLDALISSEVLSLRDESLWAEAEAQQERERAELTVVADNWHDIIDQWRDEIEPSEVD
jgi:hypothetical protein